MGYVKSTNERWARAESATLRKACEAQTAAGKDCDPAFWQKLIADGLFPGRSWRALQRRAWARKWYRPRWRKFGVVRPPRSKTVVVPPAAVERMAAAAAVQGTLPLTPALPRVVGGMLAVKVTAADGKVVPVAVALEGLIVGTDTVTGEAVLHSAGKRILTMHPWQVVMDAIERATVAGKVAR